tara:strand:- start:1050 stop:1760 length:711 start_codon:yes stop_codon:yes gene_type:complete
MAVVVFDVETDSTFATCGAAPGDREHQFQCLQITIACSLELDAAACASAAPDEALARARARHWWRDVARPGEDPFEDLLRSFDSALVIVAFNGLDFDFGVLKKHYHGDSARYLRHRCKCLDSFATIRACTGIWAKLDTLLKANKLITKSGDGLEAIVMWNAGRRDALRSYCAQDVTCLASLVLLEEIVVPGAGILPHRVFGVRAALAAATATKGRPPSSPPSGPCAAPPLKPFFSG